MLLKAKTDVNSRDSALTMPLLSAADAGYPRPRVDCARTKCAPSSSSLLQTQVTSGNELLLARELAHAGATRQRVGLPS